MVPSVESPSQEETPAAESPAREEVVSVEALPAADHVRRPETGDGIEMVLNGVSIRLPESAFQLPESAFQGTTRAKARSRWLKNKSRVRRRGMRGQLRARKRERDARRGAARVSQEVGTTPVALTLGRSSRTIRRWAQQEREGDLLPEALGRRPNRSTPASRNAVLWWLRNHGRLDREVLLALVPTVPRREIEELKARYRGVSTVRDRDVMQALAWNAPGTVWAIDFTDVGLDVDGVYPHMLLVRDLASGRQLLAWPCECQDAQAVRDLLEELFVRYGAPLLIKSDNGSSFLTEAIQDLLAQYGVTHLLSPPYTPWYNGACEAGVGSVKYRALRIAARNGRPGRWTCDDVEQAVELANRTARPWGRRGPTPQERWEGRSRITEGQRAAFQAEVAARQVEGFAHHPGPIAPDQVAAILRASIAGGLRKQGLLSSSLVEIPSRRSPRRRHARGKKAKCEGATSSSH